MNINETQSKLYSIGPKLKSNLVTEQTVRFPKKYSKHVMPTKSKKFLQHLSFGQMNIPVNNALQC